MSIQRSGGGTCGCSGVDEEKWLASQWAPFAEHGTGCNRKTAMRTSSQEGKTSTRGLHLGIHGFEDSRNVTICALWEYGRASYCVWNFEELMAPIIRALDLLGFPGPGIYNFDETGLFYKAMPSHTLACRSDDGAGMKADKCRLTVGLMVNADGRRQTCGHCWKVPMSTRNFWCVLGRK